MIIRRAVLAGVSWSRRCCYLSVRSLSSSVDVESVRLGYSEYGDPGQQIVNIGSQLPPSALKIKINFNQQAQMSY